MDPNTPKSKFPGDLTNQFLEQPEVCLSKIQGRSSADSFSHTTEDFKLNDLMIMVGKTATNPHITHKTISIYKQQI